MDVLVAIATAACRRERRAISVSSGGFDAEFATEPNYQVFALALAKGLVELHGGAIDIGDAREVVPCLSCRFPVGGQAH